MNKAVDTQYQRPYCVYSNLLGAGGISSWQKSIALAYSSRFCD